MRCFCIPLFSLIQIPVIFPISTSPLIRQSRACLKNHSCNLHVPICGRFCLHSVAVARYVALIQAKSPTNCNAHLTESIFQTRSSPIILIIVLKIISYTFTKRKICRRKTHYALIFIID